MRTDTASPHGEQRDACAESSRPQHLELQRELNDNLALIRILDPPSPFDDDFRPSASEAVLGSNKQRRQTLLNFIAFCLARDNNTVALATTIHRRSGASNQLVLHIARSTGSTTSYERERAVEFLNDLKQAWRTQAHGDVQNVMGHVVQMTSSKLRKRLNKLRDALRDLRGGEGFASAVDAWGMEELSPHVFHWMTTCNCESPVAALKNIVYKLAEAAASDNFDTPPLCEARFHHRISHSYFFPVAVLLSSQFFHEVEFSHTSLAPDLVRLLRQLRRRCVKLRWYEIGVHLLCTCAREAVLRILGADAFDKFLREDGNDALWIEWLETPGAMPEPMPRKHRTAQDALLSLLPTTSDASDDEEPFVCTIAHSPSATIYWTPTCVTVYHPELQIIDHLCRREMRPSPAYIGCSLLACRACKFYVDQLDAYNMSLYTAGLDVMDLKAPTDWLIPPSRIGLVCASIIRREAARLVLREDNIQRIAWEMRSTSETLGFDEAEAPVNFVLKKL